MLRRIPVILLLMLTLALPAYAQRTTATVRGTVADGAGNPIPGATVVLNSVNTGYSRSTFSNGEGNYFFPDVPIGAYEVVVSLQGFMSVKVEGIELNVADVREVNAALEVGELTEQVLVVSNAIPVETMSGEVAGLIEGEEARELPLNGRNFAALTLLMPGVSAPDGFNTKNKGLLTGVDLSVSGGGVTGNLWTVDGANNNDVGSNRTIMIYPSLEAIEEFKIHRNSYGAEFGGASGAQINLVTRSGSNQLHGSAFFSFRDDSLNASNYFLKESELEKEPLERKDFGYSLGGPLVKDKLYFFWVQEWNREQRGVVRTGFVPTAGERVGNFNDRVDGCSPPVPNDPLTGSPFPNNTIPGDRISPGGLAFLDLYPQPNVNLPGTCINWVSSPRSPINWRQENMRLDWDAGDNTRIMVRYTQDSWVNGSDDQPNAGESNGLWGDDPFPTVDSQWDQPGRSFTTQLNQTIGDTGINTLQFSYSANEITVSRSGDNALNSRINANIPTVFPDAGKTGGADRSHPVFWGSQGYGALWNMAPWQNDQDLIVFKDDYSQVFGDHFIKAGATYSTNAKQETIGGSSAYESPHLWGGAGINGWGATSGNVLGDFLLKDMTHGFDETLFEPDPRLRWQDIEFYLSDSWQVDNNVTLDLGARVSRLNAPYDEADGITNWNPDRFDPALGGNPCNGLMEVPGNNDCQSAGYQGASAAPGRGLVENSWLFSPRLGMAWDISGTGRSAIRAGLGRFYLRDRVNIQLEMAGNPPFVEYVAGIRKLDDAAEPCGGCFSVNGGVPRVGMELDSNVPHNWQWNLTYEQRFGRNTTVEIGYVGSKGVNLTRRSDINQVPSGDANGNGISDRLEYLRATGNPGAASALRPYGAFGDVGILYWEHDGESIYHSLQTQFRTRFGRGSMFQASYTLSRFEANDPLTDSGAGMFNGQITDRDNLQLDDGLAGIDRTHVFNASLVMRLPTFEGRGGLVEALFGDWQLGGIVIAQSGTPLTVYTGGLPGINGPSGTGYTDNQRPNLVPGQSCTVSGSPDQQYLNPDAYTLEGFELGTIGNAGRGSCRGPGFVQVDLSLDKSVQLGDRVNGRVRIEVFNLFNTNNFTGVNTFLGTDSVEYDGPIGEATRIVSHSPSGAFGKAFGVRDPRQVQIGFRLEF